MSKTGIELAAKSLGSFLRKNGSKILIGLGIGGFATATVFAVKATPKALELKKEAEKEKGAPLTAGETVKACWKCYIPTVCLTVASAGCVLVAHKNDAKKNAALATAYSLSENALREYQQKVVETIGEKKETEIRDEIAKDKVAQHPVSTSEVFITKKGQTLFFEPISARYFHSDPEAVRRAINDLNREMIGDMYVSVNDLYQALGLTPTSIGDDLGWNVNKALIDISFSGAMAENETPCLAISYRNPPIYDYNNY